jgi:hypothetical protein
MIRNSNEFVIGGRFNRNAHNGIRIDDKYFTDLTGFKTTTNFMAKDKGTLFPSDTDNLVDWTRDAVSLTK